MILITVANDNVKLVQITKNIVKVWSSPSHVLKLMRESVCVCVLSPAKSAHYCLVKLNARPGGIPCFLNSFFILFFWYSFFDTFFRSLTPSMEFIYLSSCVKNKKIIKHLQKFDLVQDKDTQLRERFLLCTCFVLILSSCYHDFLA